MPTPIVLTAHQTEAVQFLTDHLHDGEPLVALRGLAGTGKTSLIPALIDVLESTGLPVTLGAPTHRAAMILKKKGLEQADTVHSHALMPYFTADYHKALRWLGEACPCRLEELANAHPPVEMDGQQVPWLIAERLRVVPLPPLALKARASQYSPKKAIESVGIYGRKHFAGFGPKEGEGVLVIDEASMVGTEMLRLCQEAFPQICLVGDPGQLPPVKDRAALATVRGWELTEIHRQAKDSPIVQLAYAAREGKRFWERIPLVPGQLEEYTAVAAQAFLTSPLLVWRNKTRISCTLAIREALGYAPGCPVVGEPLVCRSSDPRARVDGFYNNALFRIVETSAHNPRLVTVQPDGDSEAETHDVLLHMEEEHGDNINPEAIPFRYGYAYTAHTAQGGEWPTVYISKPDLFAHTRRRVPDEEVEQAEQEFRQWTYTAITRAKQTLGFLTKHDFTRSVAVVVPQWPKGDMMPKMKQEPVQESLPADALGGGLPHVDDVPDIPDPVVPPGTVEPPPVAAPAASAPPVAPTVPPLPDALLPLAHGFCQHLQAQVHTFLGEEHRSLQKSVDASLDAVRKWSEGVIHGNEHAEYSLADALLQLRERGITVTGSPYTATVTATSADGFSVTLTIQKPTSGDLVEEIGRLLPWMKAEGFTAAAMDYAA